ncbi:hypothetical protein IHE44_0004735, partial [Lamprotornis superbus]
WLFDQALCTLCAFCGLLFGLCSLGSLTLLSTVCWSSFSWSHAVLLAVCLYALAQWGSYSPEPYGTTCCISWGASSRENMLYILFLFIFCYLLPCLLILASCRLILWMVWESQRAVRQHRTPWPHRTPRQGTLGLHSLLL